MALIYRRHEIAFGDYRRLSAITLKIFIFLIHHSFDFFTADRLQYTYNVSRGPTMNKVLTIKFKEALFSVLPITIVILILNFVLPEAMSPLKLISFIIGAVLLIVGMALYSLGSDTALAPIGETIGNKITETKRIWLILLVGFIIGVIVTVAEPDLMVLGTQLGDVKWIIIITVSLGVGAFLVVALGRIFRKINLNIVLIVLYALVFLLALFVDKRYIALSFDSGGVTTGPVTVPFIIALGVGVASVLGGKGQKDNSFGVVAICSVGPVFTVLLLCMIFKPEINVGSTVTAAKELSQYLPFLFSSLGACARDVAIAIVPVTLFFLVFQFVFLNLPKQRFARIIIGLLYTYVGLTLFLTGVNTGFMSTGLSLGSRIAALDNKWILVVVGAGVGSLMVLAEPAVHVLAKQVENISDGAIKSKSILAVLCISMMISVGLSMIRIITGLSLWYFILPGYAIAIILSFFVPKIFTAIAFDSGGVASGPMASTFMLPLAIGAVTTMSGAESVMTDAYGLIAFIALTPLITVQILGLVVRIKAGRKIVLPKAFIELFEGDIISLDANRK